MILNAVAAEPDLCRVGVLLLYAVWQFASWIAGIIFFCVLVLLIWIAIESELYVRRLRRMQRETDEKRSLPVPHAGEKNGSRDRGTFAFSPKKPPKRARFLP